MDNGISENTGNDEEDVRSLVSWIVEDFVPTGQGERIRTRRPSDVVKPFLDECLEVAHEIYDVIKDKTKIVELGEKLKRLARMYGTKGVEKFFNGLCELFLAVVSVASLILLLALIVAILACAGYYLLPMAIEAISTYIISNIGVANFFLAITAGSGISIKAGLHIQYQPPRNHLRNQVQISDMDSTLDQFGISEMESVPDHLRITSFLT